MTERSGFSGTDMLVAVVGAAAAGATIALLTAPRSGRDTRARISEYVDSGRDKAHHFPHAMKSASYAARDAFTEVMSQGAGT
jgi:gas vesicle protein